MDAQVQIQKPKKQTKIQAQYIKHMQFLGLGNTMISRTNMKIKVWDQFSGLGIVIRVQRKRSGSKSLRNKYTLLNR